MSDLPSGWIEKVSNSTGRAYYYNAQTKESQWEKPSGNVSGSVRASHLLVKHNQSRRPFSWRQEEEITRSKAEALSTIESKYSIFSLKDLLKLLLTRFKKFVCERLGWILCLL